MKTVIEMALSVVPEEDREDAHGYKLLRLTYLEIERFAELVRADEREAMVAEAAKQGWAMKNEDPFEDCVREIAAIRARTGEQK